VAAEIAAMGEDVVAAIKAGMTAEKAARAAKKAGKAGGASVGTAPSALTAGGSKKRGRVGGWGRGRVGWVFMRLSAPRHATAAGAP
jgi:hypothetical protein